MPNGGKTIQPNAGHYHAEIGTVGAGTAGMDPQRAPLVHPP